MVAAILLIIGLVAAVIIFKDNIAAFVGGSILNPVGEAVAGVGASASRAVQKANDDIFQAGVESRKNIDTVVLNINREAKTKEIEKAALEQGFSSLEEFERATDSCSLVVGSSRTMCDVGVIGDPVSITPKGGQTAIGTNTPQIAGKPIKGELIITNETVERLSNLQQARNRRGR